MTWEREIARYRDGLWIQNRKRAYLYWFKFLQEAEKSDEYVVQWNKYDGWGGNQIVDMKFDSWWEDHWKNLFGFVEGDEAKFKFSTIKIKEIDALRKSLLIWQNRYVGRNLNKKENISKKGMNMLEVARVVVQKEIVTRRKMKKEKLSLYLKNIDIYWEGTNDKGIKIGMTESMVQQTCGRYLRQAQGILKNVSDGRFP
jgi:hypothetical protein